VPKPYPKEFRDDVVRVARNREPGQHLRQIAADFGVSESCLTNWLRNADVEDGTKPGTTNEESRENRELRKRIRLLEQENEVLRRAAAYLSQANLPGKMMFPRTREVPPPLVRELAAGGIPVAAGVPGSGDRAPAVLPVARRPGHRRRTRGGVPGERPVRRPPRGPGVRLPVPRRRSPRCGESMSDRTAWRICSTNRWWSVFGKKRGSKKGRSGPPVHDDLVGRVFTADAPNTLWLNDITEHRTEEGKLYLCAVKDVYSNRIVGYSISDRMKSRLAVTALESAVARRDSVAGCVVHSDRGSQFRSRKFVRALARHDLVGSMGRVGAAGDNAAMESFFALLQKNVLDRQRWATREQLRIAIVTWIERTYHRRRRQLRLGRLTPVEFETIMTTPATQAA